MISTVTTSTITTITTMADFGVILGTVAVVTLVVLLCTRELAAAAEGHGSMRLARSLDVSIIPLVMVFAAVITMKVLTVLG